MSQSFRLRFLLFALPFIMAIALLAAVQPIGGAAPALPQGNFRGHPFERPGGIDPGFQGRFPQNARRGPPRHFVPAPVAPPVGGFTVDGFRLLAALAVTGAFTGLVWLTFDGVPVTPLTNSSSTLLERDVMRLREEVDSLQREQRHLRTTLDWQDRLLTGDRRPDGDET
ncbi:MAG TPA: hypothetical protein VIU62_06130 [Chloroflexota bacterium]